MSEDKTYILKPGVTFGESNDKDYVHMYPYFTASMRADIHKSIFDQCFTEFSFDATRKQIEEEARELLKGYVLLTSPFSDSGFNPSKEELEQIETDDILKFVDRVLALLGGTTNGK